jgi:beta-mannosidase
VKGRYRSVFEQWKLKDYAPGGGLASGAFKGRFDEAGWLDVAVPGDVHTALISSGRIDDPYYDRNEEGCSWIEDREWWYRTSFEGPEEPLRPHERLRLIFRGLDTFATVWLNGEELGKHHNMFREAAFEVGESVRPGQNTLAVLFDRPLDHVGEVHPDQWGRNPERVFMRKAQFGFGWDWGPRLPTVGIWRPVELRRERFATIEGVHFYTLDIAPTGERAAVAVRVEAEPFASDAPLEAAITLGPPGEGPAARSLLVLEGEGPNRAGTAYVTVESPRLWWTHDLGEPALYDLSVDLLQEGDVLDHHVSRVGIRTLELDQSPDPEEPGTRYFRFVLNGVPIFARGADWIPADSFVGAITRGRYQKLISAARGANMNMLRVWGGGIYEHDVFYDFCNSTGLLVWQDFMFACAVYPEEPPSFVAEVEAEARYQVGRLRAILASRSFAATTRTSGSTTARSGTATTPPSRARSTTTRCCHASSPRSTAAPRTGQVAPSAATTTTTAARATCTTGRSGTATSPAASAKNPGVTRRPRTSPICATGRIRGGS